MVTLRVGGCDVAGAGGVFADRDAVPDGDLLGSDEDVLDEQTQHALLLRDVGGVGAGAQAGQEAYEVVGELEVDLPVRLLGVQGVDLGAQAGFSGTQVRDPGAELVDSDQFFW